MLDASNDDESTILDLPDSPKAVVQSLLDIVYSGSIEATLEEMRNMLTLAHSLYISVPVSDQLINMLGLKLPLQPALQIKPKDGPIDFTGKYQNSHLFVYISQCFSQWDGKHEPNSHEHATAANLWSVCYDERTSW